MIYHTSTQYGLGTAYRLLNFDRKAEQSFNRAIELQQDFFDAYRALIFLYVEQGQYEKAIRISEKAISVAPENAMACNLSTLAHFFARNYQSTIDSYEKNELRYTGGATPLLRSVLLLHIPAYIVFSYQKLGIEKNAPTEYQLDIDLLLKDIEAGSEHPDVPLIIAQFYAAQGNKQLAYEWLQKAIDAGWREYRLALHNPLFENIRGDKPFLEMIDQVRMAVQEMRIRVEAGENN